MATIISHHMTMRAASGGVRIASMPGESPSAARVATYHQPSAASAATVAAISARSWRRTRLVRSGADDTAAAEVQVRELAVTVLHFERHRPVDRARRAADVGDGIFES